MSLSKEEQTAHYDALAKEHGSTHLGGQHGSEANRKLRYHTLLGNLLGTSWWEILDVGCGTGWLCNYWDPTLYTGIDLSSEAIKVAQQEHPKHRLRQGDARDVTKHYDIIVASGTFEYVHTNKVMEIVAHLWSKTERMLAFNLLSVKAPEKHADDYYHDPAEVLRILSPLSDRFELLHNYMDHEFTLRMFK